MAQSIADFFKEERNRELFARIEERGLKMIEERTTQTTQLPLAGKTFVLTGNLENFTRSEASERIEALGGKASSSVSNKTSFLLAGPGAGSKLAKAEKLGTSILDEAAFLELLEENEGLKP